MHYALRKPGGRRIPWSGAFAAALAMASVTLAACSSGGGGGSGSGADGGSPADGPLTNVTTITESITATYWRQLVAEQMGFFAKEGLKVNDTLVNATSTVNPLISGDTDISFAEAGQTVQAIDQGAPLQMVGSGMDRAQYALVAAKGTKSIANLKGATIGAASPTDVYTQIMYQILAKNGVSRDQVHMIFGSSSTERAAALQGGAIKATLVPPPTDQKLSAAGYPILTRTTSYVSLVALSVEAVNKNWAEKNPATLKKYLKALADATTWLYDPSNKAKALSVLEKGTSATPTAAAGAYQEYIVAGKAFNAGACVEPAAITTLLGYMRAEGETKAASAAPYYTKEYCP